MALFRSSTGIARVPFASKIRAKLAARIASKTLVWPGHFHQLRISTRFAVGGASSNFTVEPSHVDAREAFVVLKHTAWVARPARPTLALAAALAVCDTTAFAARVPDTRLGCVQVKPRTARAGHFVRAELAVDVARGATARCILLPSQKDRTAVICIVAGARFFTLPELLL